MFFFVIDYIVNNSCRSASFIKKIMRRFIILIIALALPMSQLAAGSGKVIPKGKISSLISEYGSCEGEALSFICIDGKMDRESLEKMLLQ